ncbi:hypothetical protein X926_01705 [Petrotoga sp. HWHPT.55.6.3]|nr:hypothetical protein X926_01705 [Petrotoga sp. HWHPT.55.6.3]
MKKKEFFDYFCQKQRENIINLVEKKVRKWWCSYGLGR